MYRGSYTHSIAAELAEDCPGRSEGEEREDVAVATGMASTASAHCARAAIWRHSRLIG